MTEGSKTRLGRLLGGMLLLLTLGLGYAAAVRVLGRGLYCPFYMATGLLCPGCGVSRMCLSLLRGDWMGAWRANPGLLLLSPILIALLGLHGVRYVRTGEGKMPRWESRLWIALAALLVLYGVLRNLSGIALLDPR